MPRRTQRAETLTEPLALLAALRPGRDALTRACATVRPTGPTYHVLSAALAALDALAAQLGHEGYYRGELHRTP